MWFARLFGIGHERTEGSESTTATADRGGSPGSALQRSPHAASSTRTVQPASRPATPPGIPAPRRITQRGGKPGAKGKGFDPYNSGTFDRQNAWERVSRR